MSSVENGKEIVLGMLKSRSMLKKELCANVSETFGAMKKILEGIEVEYSAELAKNPKSPRFKYVDKGLFEAELTFGGDILYFTQHSNIFNFEQTHSVHQTQYVREDADRAYCGMIEIYNFLYDSIQYNRQMDTGYLIGRLFINKEGHFFVEGKRQLGFLYNDFGGAVLNDVYLRGIIDSAMIYSIDFDLLVPPFDEVSQMTVQQKIHQQNNQAFRTGKRLGFKFQSELQPVEGRKKG